MKYCFIKALDNYDVFKILKSGEARYVMTCSTKSDAMKQIKKFS